MKPDERSDDRPIHLQFWCDGLCIATPSRSWQLPATSHSPGISNTHEYIHLLMPSAQTLAIGFIGLNSNLTCWKPTFVSNARSPAPICLTSLSVLAQIGWRMMATTPPGLRTRHISFTPAS